MDDDINPISGLTSQQRYENYKVILDTDLFFRSNGEITPEWMETHKNYICKYHTWCIDFRTTDSDIEDTEFRKKCNEVETLISYLFHQIKTTNTFEVAWYKLLNTYFKDMCRSQFGDDELEDLIAGMSIS